MVSSSGIPLKSSLTRSFYSVELVRVSSEACLDKREAMCVPSDSWKMLFCQLLPHRPPSQSKLPLFPSWSSWASGSRHPKLKSPPSQVPQLPWMSEASGSPSPKTQVPPPPIQEWATQCVSHGEKLLNEFSIQLNDLCTVIWTVLKFTILCGLDFWSFKRWGNLWKDNVFRADQSPSSIHYQTLTRRLLLLSTRQRSVG